MPIVVCANTRQSSDVKHITYHTFFAANVPYFWTSGRLCDFDGCDRPDLFPKNINGWFWSANQVIITLW